MTLHIHALISYSVVYPMIFLTTTCYFSVILSMHIALAIIS